MPQCTKKMRFKKDGEQYEGTCPDEAVWIDNTNFGNGWRKKGGRFLCDDHYQQWLKKVNKPYRGIRTKGKRITSA